MRENRTVPPAFFVKTMLLLSFSALLIIFSGFPVHARQLTSFPMLEDFNTQAQYADIACNDPGVSTHSFDPTGGWQGSGAAKFTFVNGGEDNSGLCNMIFPRELFPRRANIRWLVFYGPEFFEVSDGFGGKNLILQRCNEDCSGWIVPTNGLRSSAYRGMVLSGNHQMICENIECADYTDYKQPGKREFNASQYFNQWVSYEAEFDLANSIARLYIDTQDGTQDSQDGNSPYMVFTDWDTSNAWYSLDWLMGYWEQRMTAGPEGYFKVDELVIDDGYIGPPAGFVGSLSVQTPPPAPTLVPVAVPAPNPAGHEILGMSLMVGENRAEFDWSTINRAYARIDYGTSQAYGQSIIWWGDDRGKDINLIRLSPGTTYHYRINSTEAGGAMSTSIITGLFTTIAAENQTTTPSINSVSGTVTHGSTITITGTGFGTKEQSAPLKWDDFENGTVGQNIAPNNAQIGGAWSDWSNGGNRPQYSSTCAHMGQSAVFDFTSTGYSNWLQLFGDYPRAYFTFWWFYDKLSDEWTANLKPWIVYGSYNDQPTAYSGFGQGGTADRGLRSNLIDNQGSVDQTLWGGTNVEDVQGRWVRFEVYLEQSTPNVQDGKFKMWIHNPDSLTPINLDLNNDNTRTRITSNTWHQWWLLGAYHDNDQRSPNAQAYIYGDDVYFDTTQARVEIGDTPHWSTNTHREIQIPQSWSENSITAKVNRGSFALGSTAYLFVVDENNTASEGFAITIAGDQQNQSAIHGDINNDGFVNLADLQLVVNSFAKTAGQASYNAAADLAEPFNMINLFDVMVIVRNWGRTS